MSTHYNLAWIHTGKGMTAEEQHSDVTIMEAAKKVRAKEVH